MSEVAQATHSSPDGHSPQLRFPEFSGEWEEKKLQEVTSRVIVGLATSVTDYYTEKSDGSVPIIRNQNIKNGYFDDSDMLYLTKEFSEKHPNKRVKAGDVITVHTGSNVGLTCIVPEKYHNSQTFTTLIVTPKNSILSSMYLNQLLSSSYGSYQALRLVVGGGKGNLNTGDFKIYPLCLPLKPEQQKIAAFLTAVDNKIQQLSKKQELLGEYKKGLMQQIFSQAIRFSPKGTSSQAQGEIDDGSEFPEWEEKKLGDVVTEINKKTVINNEYPVLSSSKTGIYLQSEYFDRDVASKNNIGYKILEQGNITYRSMSDTGSFTFNIQNIIDIGIVSPAYPVFCSKEKILSYYLVLTLNSSSNIKKQLLTFKEGGTRYALSFSKFKKLRINLPSLEEQTKIANFLSSIDNKIEQVGEQLDKSKQFKKALLQQMFV